MTFESKENGIIKSEYQSIAELIFDQDTIQKTEHQIMDDGFVLFKRNYLRLILINIPLVILLILCIYTTTWLLTYLATEPHVMDIVYFLTESRWTFLFYLMQIVTLFLLIYLLIFIPLRLRKLPNSLAITSKSLLLKSRKLVDQEIFWNDITELTIWRGIIEVTNEKIPIQPLKNYRVKILSNKTETIINSIEYTNKTIDLIPKFDSFEMAFRHRKYDALTLLIEHFYQKHREEV